MSGFVGLYRRNSSAVAQQELHGMLETIAHRGGDGAGVWNEGSIGLGHRMLWTTPESLNEKLPFVCGGLAITCDARIDNRDELIRSLRIDSAPSEVSDSALILAAYEKWGRECPAKLVGDFAFAIWDSRKQELFCARDAMGVKCLYYFVSDQTFAFGSEIKAILSLPEIPRRLNEVRVLDFLINLFEDRAITFYQNIWRLPAASTLLVTRSRIQTAKYWNLDPKRELKLSSDAEYAEAFRESFMEAVRCRMRSAYPIGCAVSGGLDSTSIACVARALNQTGKDIDTFSLIFPGLPKEDLRHIDERKHIQEALGTGGFRPHFISADELSPLRDIRQVQDHLDEAFSAGNLYLHWAMFQCARKQGVRVFLDGLDGDTTVSHGFEYLADLVRGLRWRKLYGEIDLLRKNMRMGRKRLLLEYCAMPLCPTWMYTLAHWMRGQFNDMRVDDTLLTQTFKERTHLKKRVNSLLVSSRSLTRNAREKHWEMLNFPLYAHALEAADKASAAFAVEARFPFFDRRLIELCLALPPGQKLSQGWSRYVLRRAMEGILPPSIQWRPDKGNLSPNFYRRLLNGDRRLVEDTILKEKSILDSYIDPTAIRNAYHRFNLNPLRAHNESLQVFAAVNLAIWLDTARVSA